MRLTPSITLLSIVLAGGLACFSQTASSPSQTPATAPAAGTASAAGDFSVLLADQRSMSLRSEGDLGTREPAQGPAEAPQALKVAFSGKPERFWDTELTATGLETKKGTRYRLSFWARAEAPRQMLVDLSNDSSPWNAIGFNRTLQVGTEWKKYEFEVTPRVDPITVARICFKLGHSAETILIAGFRFEGPAGSAGGLAAAGAMTGAKSAAPADFHFHGPADTVTMTEDAGPAEAPKAMKIGFAKQPQRFWDVEVQANRLEVHEGKAYRLTFWARAEKPRMFLVDLSNDGSPWNPLGLNANVSVTPEWKKFDYVFRADADPRTIGRVCFKLGHTTETLWLAGMTFGEATDAEVPVVDKTKVVDAKLPPALAAKVDRTIREVRQGPFKLHVVDAAGKPVAGAEVKVKLKRHAFWFGTTLPHRNWSPAAMPDVQKKFLALWEPITTLVVPENSTKGEFWNAEPQMAKSIFELAKERGLAFKSHAPIWGWELHDRRKNIKTCAQIEADAVERLKAEFTAFKGHHAVCDVANEMISDPTIQDACGGEAKLIELHKLAHQLDPAVKLSVNDYEQMMGRGTRVDDLVKRFKAAGVPITVQAEQLHDRNYWYSPEQVWAMVDRMAANGVEVHLTELTQPDDNAGILGEYQNGVVWNAGNQAAYFEQTYRLAFGHPSVGAIVLWNMWDGASWLPRGGVVERNFTPKPAWNAINRLINQEWTTDLGLKTDGKGQAAGRGFYGLYTVTVTVKGKTQTETLDLTKGGPGDWTIKLQ